jgi:predicted nucleic acid-binding protein
MISNISVEAVFVDTSAFYALLNQNDQSHPQAKKRWEAFSTDRTSLVTHNYILVEMVALLQSRHGLEPVSEFQEGLLAPVDVHWIEPDIHRKSMEEHLSKDNRSISFVDRISLDIINNLGIQRVFAFDDDFADREFELLN